jgi:flagellar motor switch protein FliM
MRLSTDRENALSREELDALLEEMPRLLEEESAERDSGASRLADIELQRANQEFAFDAGLLLSNRHQRVIHLSLIGHREIEVHELAELMLPTDVCAAFRVLPKDEVGFLLLSRPFFFQLLGMTFGAGPTIKPTRPPTREYTRIERRFYERATREILERLEMAWKRVAPIGLAWGRLASRAAVAEAEAAERSALLATFDVKGLAESCRLRVVIPLEPFQRTDRVRLPQRSAGATGQGVSLSEVPIRLRARVGSVEMGLAEVAALRPGQIVPLDAPASGSIEIRIGDEVRFKGLAGTQGSRRAVQLTEELVERDSDHG